MMRVTKPSSVAALLTALCVSPVYGAIPDSGLLNDVTERFLTQSATWGGVITGHATWLFWVLATISMVWTFGLMALRRADIGEVFAEFFRFTVTTGFFWWLLSHGPTMAMAIVNSLRAIGAEAGGFPNALSPSTPVSIGFDIVKKAFTGLSWVHPIDNLGIVLVSAAVVIAMAVVAANLLIALVTAWVMAYAGVFILGFGGARWTSDMAISYFKAMLGIGMELLTMTLLVAVAVSVIDGFYHDLDGSSVYELLLVLCVCVVLAFLIDKIPARVAALVGGGSGAGVGAGGVMGGAMMAAAAMATGGAALAAGAASAAGGAQALMAAFAKASAAESAGGGISSLMNAAGAVGTDSNGGGGDSPLGTAMGDSGGGTSGSAGSTMASDSMTSSSSSGSSSGAGEGETSPHKTGESSSSEAGGGSARASSETRSNRTASATGAITAKAGRVAARTGVNLAQGSWDVMKAKASDIRDSAMDRIGETTGGKIAAAIKARDVATNGGVGAAQFDENSLSAGGESPDAESEVAAFRDGKTEPPQSGGRS